MQNEDLSYRKRNQCPVCYQGQNSEPPYRRFLSVRYRPPYTCETPREYCRTSVVPTQSASIRTGVNELMSRADQEGSVQTACHEACRQLVKRNILDSLTMSH